MSDRSRRNSESAEQWLCDNNNRVRVRVCVCVCVCEPETLTCSYFRHYHAATRVYMACAHSTSTQQSHGPARDTTYLRELEEDLVEPFVVELAQDRDGVLADGFVGEARVEQLHAHTGDETHNVYTAGSGRRVCVHEAHPPL